MSAIAEGRRARLSRLIEIIEACQEMDERVDADVVMGVLDELEQEMTSAAREMPATISELSPEAYTVAILLTVISAALADANEFASTVMPPGRLRRNLTAMVEQLRQVVVSEFMARARPAIRVALLAEAAAWGYMLWSPEERKRLLDLLATVSRGGYIKAADRDTAGSFVAKLQGMRVENGGGSTT